MSGCRITTFCRSNTALISRATSSDAFAAAAWSNQQSGPLETVVPRSPQAEAVAYKLEGRLTRPRRDLRQSVMQYVNGVTPDPPGMAPACSTPHSHASRAVGGNSARHGLERSRHSVMTHSIGRVNGVAGLASSASVDRVVPSRRPDRRPSGKRPIVAVDCGSTAEESVLRDRPMTAARPLR